MNGVVLENKYPFFRNNCNRVKAEQLLTSKPDGSFVVRPSSQAGAVSLSQKRNGTVVHSLIFLDDSGLFYGEDNPSIRRACLKELLQTFVGLRLSEQESSSVLLQLIERGDVNGVSERLQDHDLNTSVSSDGSTLLHHAARRNRGQIVKMLLERGASAARKNLYAMTPLHFAARAGAIESAEALLSIGDADVEAMNSTLHTPLMLATAAGHAELVRLLLVEHFANPDHKNKSGNSALHIAARDGYCSIAELLIDKGGASIDLRNGEGKTAFSLANEDTRTSLREYVQTRLRKRSAAGQDSVTNESRREHSSTTQGGSVAEDRLLALSDNLSSQFESILDLERAAEQQQCVIAIVESNQQSVVRLVNAKSQEQEANIRFLRDALRRVDERHEVAARNLLRFQREGAKSVAALEARVSLLEREADVRRTQLRSEESFANGPPNLLIFYRAIQTLFEQFFISAKAAAGGFVQVSEMKSAASARAGKAAARMAKGFELGGAILGMIPIVGNVLEGVVELGHLSLAATSEKLKKNAIASQQRLVRRLSSLLSLSQIMIVASLLATRLTECFREQLKMLPEPGASQSKTAVNLFAEFCFSLIVARLEKVEEYPLLFHRSSQELTNELFDSLLSLPSEEEEEQKPSLPRFFCRMGAGQITQLLEFIRDQFANQSIETEKGIKWRLVDILLRPGLRTAIGDQFVGPNTDPKTFGWIQGSIDLAGKRQLRRVQENPTQLVHSSSLHREQERQREQRDREQQLKLEKLERTVQVALSASKETD